jgi:indolepyruvate decarboxylase
MTKDCTVGRYLVERLSQIGLDHLFSIAGDYAIRWLNDYVEPSSIQIIQEVNELNAGYAADGYARLKGIGALCATYSAGSLCAVNPIAGAYVERVPIVLINGTPSIKQTLTFEQTGFSAHHFITGRETDLQAFEHITAAAVRLDNPDLAPLLIDYCLSQCISTRQPVYIELLSDIINLDCEPPRGTLTRARVISDPDSLTESLAKIIEQIQRASNPLIWVGVEVDRYGLHAKVERLLQKLNIPFVTELMSKSVVSEDNPLFMGVLNGQASTAAVQDMVKQSDFMLALGVWLTDINSLGWQPDYAKTAFASLQTVKLGTFFSAQVSLADLVDGLLETELSPYTPQPVLSERIEVAFNPDPEDQVTYQGFYDFIPRFIDQNTIIGADSSLNYFGSMLLKVSPLLGFIAQPSYSAIGYIAPAATGVCLAKSKNQRVMVFTGDGGFQMSAQCLSTQTRFGLNPIIFVIDNGVYGVEQWLADASIFETNSPASQDSQGQPFFKECLLHRWDYSKLADVFHCKGWKANTYHELEDAINGALTNLTGPSIIQVVVPSKSIPSNAKWKEAIDQATGG